MALIKRGYPAVSLLADQICIHTDNKFGKARITAVDNQRLLQELEQGHIVVAAGFQGRDFEGNVTTLGRGGSDTSAVALAAALKADECQIYTDVDGVYTIDPRICADAKRLSLMPCSHMLELASLGAKVLHSRSVEYAALHRVPLRVLSTFKPDAGTLITYEDDLMVLPTISGIAGQTGVTLLKLQQLSASQLQQVMQSLAELNIETDMLQQDGEWPQQLTLSFSLAMADLSQVTDAVQKITENSMVSLHHPQQNLAKLSVVGVGIKSDPMLLAKIFSILHDMNVQIWLMSNSESRFSVLIAAELLEKVARALHQALVTTEN
jgi:aspartate kinase